MCRYVLSFVSIIECGVDVKFEDVVQSILNIYLYLVLTLILTESL